MESISCCTQIILLQRLGLQKKVYIYILSFVFFLVLFVLFCFGFVVVVDVVVVFVFSLLIHVLKKFIYSCGRRWTRKKTINVLYIHPYLFNTLYYKKRTLLYLMACLFSNYFRDLFRLLINYIISLIKD